MLNIFNIELKSPLSQDNLCVAPKSLWNGLQCSQKKEARRNPDQIQDPDQNRETRRNFEQKQQRRGPVRGQIRSSANLRRSFFPSFSEMVFQMQQTLGKEKPKDLELGQKTSGSGLEGAIVRLKATEGRRSMVGEGRLRELGGGGAGAGGQQGAGEGVRRGGGIRNGRVEKDLLWRGHQCYYNPASCYWTEQRKINYDSDSGNWSIFWNGLYPGFMGLMDPSRTKDICTNSKQKTWFEKE